MSAIQPFRRKLRTTYWSAPKERVIMQSIHWGVVIVVTAFIFVLALLGKLDKASVTALYGGILGHVGTSASQKLSARSSDIPQTMSHEQPPTPTG